MTYPKGAPACPKCQGEMTPMQPSGYWPEDGREPEYDHWWCGACAEVVLFEEHPPTNDEIRRQLGPTGKERTR